MRIGTRFSLLAFGTATVAGLIIIFSLTYWEFAARKALWIAAVETTLATNSSWPSTLHFSDTRAATRELGFLSNHAKPLTFASAFRVDGELIATTPVSDTTPPRPEREREQRLEVLPATIDWSDLATENSSPLAEKVFVLSVPIMSPINPMTPDLAPAQYREQLAGNDGSGARYVVGYVEVGVSLADLIRVMAGQVLTIIAYVAVGLLITLLVIRQAARSISAPLEQIAMVADAITRNDLPKNPMLPINRNDEVGEIAGVLNGVLEGVHRMKTKMDVDKQLMSMRVDSTAKKLSQAEEKVSKTRMQMKRVAYFDPVTGLPNRRLMLEQLGMMMQIAAREQRHVGLLVVDLGSLKRINETLGRDAADDILRQLSHRVTDSVRSSDVISHDEKPRGVGRMGNDELCIILHGIATPEDALHTAERLHKTMCEPVYLNDDPLSFDFHMGIAIAPEHARAPDELVRAAEIAVKDAQSKNIKGAHLFEPAMDEVGTERLQIEMDLRKAKLHKEFELHYQPQIDVNAGRIVGAEALVRWNHPSKGMVPPFKFIPVAEETGLIVDLGNWVLRSACEDLARLNEHSELLPKISVNVSALQLTPEFINEVGSVIRETGIQPNQLELELTETMLVQDVQTVLDKLRRLHDEIGVRLSVDDFGTGYSSLAYLSQFPLDELKVDRSFVIAMDKDESAAKVAGAIIAMGRELSLDVVVEGVDSNAQLERLKGFGAEVIQGFLFSKPVPLAELEQYARAEGFRAIIDAS